jgi:hemerythrin-like metal-binding protein
MVLSNFPIAWSSELSVNVKEIDEQHRYFVTILNKLYAASLSLGGQAKIPQLFMELGKYGTEHFSTEEKYFDKFNYAGAFEHKEAHKKFNAAIGQYAVRIKQGQDITLELLDFVENWLIDHLSSFDKKYTQCFNEHGLY